MNPKDEITHNKEMVCSECGFPILYREDGTFYHQRFYTNRWRYTISKYIGKTVDRLNSVKRFLEMYRD